MSSSVAWESTDDVISRVAEDVKVTRENTVCFVRSVAVVHLPETQGWIPTALLISPVGDVKQTIEMHAVGTAWS